MPKAIGIDLGTTYSCVAVYENGNVTIIANDQGNRTTPSYVSFSETEHAVGDAAKNQANLNPTNTFYDIKRLIGRKYDDASVQSDKKHFSFQVVDDGGKPMAQSTIDGKATKYSPEQISSMILQKMKSTAEAYLGAEVKDAVITVPAYFNDAQRQATKDAGLIAGLNVLRIINEPTAAAIAYGLEKKKVDVNGDSTEHNILVFDLGGGTFDVSVLAIEDGVFEVKATHGDCHLGGSDFDQLLTDYLLEEFLKKNKGVLTKEQITDKTRRRLRSQAERAKRTLSTSTEANIEVDALCEGIDFATTVRRAKFEDLCGRLFRKTLESVEHALTDAKMSKSQIDEVVLVGGSTRIPKVQQILSEYFNGKELCKSINPDEAVAYGAAVQAAILTGDAVGDANNVVLLDVTPLSLGIETSGQFMTNIIDRNSRIPCKKSQVFTTFKDNQEAVTICVLQGERKMSKDNNLLDRFNLEGIPPAPRGTPQIEVSFNIDANGITTVTAMDKVTKKEKVVKIENKSGKLSKEDIERMIEDAERFKEQDMKNMERAEAKNSLENKIYTIRSSLDKDENKDKLAEVDQTTLTALKDYMTESLEWLNGSDQLEKEDYLERTKRLDEMFDPIGAGLNQGSEGTDGSSFNPGSMDGSGSGMPDLSPEQMAQFEEMMKDPAKRAQMEQMAQQMGAGQRTDPMNPQGPKVEEID
jgi:heat shock 70kDa protein 1/2/6/8